MKKRSGFAYIVALWFLVVITIVGLQFQYDARERRQLGLVSADRARGSAAALGALNLLQAELEAALVAGPTNTSNASLNAAQAADPWLGIDTLYNGTVMIGDVPVDVYPLDLGTQLNIDSMKTTQWNMFWNLLVKDPSMAQKLTGAILDWIDTGTTARSPGAHAAQYITDGLLTLPPNAPFREVDQLLQVDGMTPDYYQLALPYITTHGSGVININTADTVVLQSLPGMTSQIMASLLALRSNGRRITSIEQAFPRQAATAARGGAAGGRGGAAAGGGGQQLTPQQQQLEAATTASTTQVELTFIARPGRQAEPTRLQAILTRSGTTSTISWKQW